MLSLMSGNSNINTSPRKRDARSSSSGIVVSYPNSRDGGGYNDDNTMGYGENGEHEEPECDKSTECDVEEVRNALGVMKVQGGKSYYRGETHWVAILSEVSHHHGRILLLNSRLITPDSLPRSKNTMTKPNKNTRVSLR